MVKNLPVNAGDMGSIPGLGRSPGVENGNPLQYPCLENSMNREPGRIQSMGSQRMELGICGSRSSYKQKDVEAVW